MANSTLTKAEQLARSEVGYREGPKNNENKFGKWFGWDQVAWCAIFLSWLSYHSGLTYLGAPWRFASTVSAQAHAKKNNRWTTTPTVGTFAMMKHTSTTGHVGYVIALLRRAGQLIVVTIEGNTNDQGAREGNGVWIRERAASSWDGYIVLDQTHTVEDDMGQLEGKQAVWLEEIWLRTKGLEAVAERDINTLRPLIVEAIELIKNSPDHGPVGEVDAEAVVDEFARRLTELE